MKTFKQVITGRVSTEENITRNVRSQLKTIINLLQIMDEDNAIEVKNKTVSLLNHLDKALRTKKFK